MQLMPTTPPHPSQLFTVVVISLASASIYFYFFNSRQSSLYLYLHCSISALTSSLFGFHLSPLFLLCFCVQKGSRFYKAICLLTHDVNARTSAIVRSFGFYRVHNIQMNSHFISSVSLVTLSCIVFAECS